ncbi:alpha/beta hydrolase [Pseudochelatococcus sp. B33]
MTAAVIGFVFPLQITQAADSLPIGNVVIVHGAFVDGSSWREVSDILTKQGLKVTIVQQPMTSLKDDIDATNRVLDLQTGPTLLVGHSYGGVVISEAGNHSAVAGLVYVAAFQPDKGESLFSLASGKPAKAEGIRETKDGKYLYLDQDHFASDFAADLPKADADFLARSQVFASKEAASATISNPAWRDKKSWAVVATQDHALNPDLERDMAKRAKSTVIEIDSSHAVFASHPQEIADLILKASKDAISAAK